MLNHEHIRPMTKAKRVAIYVSVSTDERTIALQRRSVISGLVQLGVMVARSASLRMGVIALPSPLTPTRSS